MQVSQYKFERRDVRLSVAEHAVHGKVTIVGTDFLEPFMIWDLSPRGIGICLNQSIPPESLVVVDIFSDQVTVTASCRVAWCHRSRTSYKNEFRAGLSCQSQDNQGAFAQLLEYLESLD